MSELICRYFNGEWCTLDHVRDIIREEKFRDSLLLLAARHRNTPLTTWRIMLLVATAIIITLLCSLYYLKFRKYRMAEKQDEEKLERLLYELEAPVLLGKSEMKGGKLQFFSYQSIASATNDFSIVNKLGEGGFGPVFKGKLHNGEEVAIKRLSENSSQGAEEFKNETMLIAQLQHTNLVRLVGCCITKQYKMLIYEYMSNKSLDLFLFDPEKKQALDWKKRLLIIEGIAEGLLYLHKYSRLRIIHRDLKASNILLDCEMNPKISDFGMARIVEPNDQCQAKTRRIAGTYGYISPEYAMEGIFSTKSDVFSFGVLVLEIVSGRKNTSFYRSDGPINLIAHAWELWREGRGLELMDTTLAQSCERSEVLRCIQMGLLCVEDNPIDRPSMSDVTTMMHNGCYQLPPPKQPAFYKTLTPSAECDKLENYSLNEMSISEIEAR